MKIYGYVRVSSTDQKCWHSANKTSPKKAYTLTSFRERILTDRHIKNFCKSCVPGICSISSLSTVSAETTRKFKTNGGC